MFLCNRKGLFDCSGGEKKVHSKGKGFVYDDRGECGYFGCMTSST